MRNLLKKIIAITLSLLLLFAPGMSLFAEEPTARNISVFRVEGEEARIARTLGGTSTFPRDGQRLNVGNVMTTGRDTQVYMQLDTESVLKMDEESQVAVGHAGNRLSLSVFYGSALVDARQQVPGHTLETRIGNITTGVRGTIFTAGIREDNEIVVTMLSGEGAINVMDGTGAVEEIPLLAGYVFWVDHGDYEVLPIDLDTMSLFELEEAYYRGDYLLEIGTFTQEMLDRMPQLIDARRGERDARRAAEEQTEEYEYIVDETYPDETYPYETYPDETYPTPTPAPTPVPTPVPTPEPTPEPGTHQVTARSLHVRSTPDSEYPDNIITIIYYGDRVVEEDFFGWRGNERAWLYVRLVSDRRQVSGWVFGRYLLPL